MVASRARIAMVCTPPSLAGGPWRESGGQWRSRQSPAGPPARGGGGGALLRLRAPRHGLVRPRRAGRPPDRGFVGGLTDVPASRVGEARPTTTVTKECPVAKFIDVHNGFVGVTDDQLKAA